ncbi:MAG: bifunctional 2-polyprenyl-6-hydroxyphenol methylase/3-demethylubiquinol 3-O-methyltransferase UbiG [Pseudomonadota bacterium]|nr:bifunctional 2-polyprenyl-6-hydroxyphenol methylase/3-demethylubiquinol 3-O-methyltransferase UbiG [Pseudomonadota bacterium]
MKKGIPSQFDRTIDADEINKFAAMAEEWWDEDGKFKPLHKLNPVRITFLKDHIAAHFSRNPLDLTPLSGLKILDIGCGGGLIAEPLTRLGANVTGLDASKRNIEVAKLHANKMGLEIEYKAAAASDLVKCGSQFDAVVNLEVIEHVADVNEFMKDCTSLIKPNGLMILATLNRTAQSYALAIIGAEYLLRWLPRGTHDWRKFIRPSELARLCRKNALDLAKLCGLRYNPFSSSWNLAERDLAVNYIAVIKRRKKDPA